MKRRLLLTLAALLAFSPLAHAQQEDDANAGLPEFAAICDSIKSFMMPRAWIDKPVYVEKVTYRSRTQTLQIYFCRELSCYPFRPGDVRHIYAIVRENHPLRDEGWSDGLLVVSQLLESIARSGSPRCCKRDARVAVADAVDHFNALGEAPLEKAATQPVCSVFPQNTVCAGAQCAYHPAHE